MFPEPSRATPIGLLNRAAPFVPSTLPETPANPTIVVTTQSGPWGVICRIVLLLKSATYTVSAPSTATPQGALKRAAPLVPSSEPALPGEPARVVTTQSVPTGVIFRTVELYKSVTYKAPAPSTATP